MALFLFTKAILEGRPIDVFNHGKMKRDFTYVDDIVQGVIKTLDHTAEPDATYNADAPNPSTSNAPFRVFNIGNNNPVELMSFIEAIEDAVGQKAEKNFMPLQDGDVPATYANTDALNAWTGFVPATPVPVGIGRFVEWYRSYYKV
jgi:UDP-glucuronate 4-epimerase